ncbi:Transposon Ty3-G Gag-Pol polyprotein [Sesamum angolense]|uniref:Transposon Ty3-G Gag-Pol polyprotein n=1 Tax=Sesamum angolense TaxID=2727404 RepID=A0AAE1T5C6_9LAMI|nr:Transposon Ty3-G Gag-Pol polyprotein [Sesamum angolense]
MTQSANRDRIETWDVLKKELKDQFLPCNTSWLARESLRKLKHAGTVRDYVKEFSSLMLDVRDMSEEDKLFNFLSGLQTWAQTELRRQGVKDLPSAISAADRLVDFRVTNHSDPEKKKQDSGKEKGRFWTALFNMMGTELKFSTANHPQTDGQTERVNALVEDYLRHYVSASQRNWVDLLDVAQFSYNLHKSSATGMSPFELAYGQQPTTPHEISVQRTGGKCPAAYRRHVEFGAGDQVLLKLTPQIWKKISSKSVHRGLIPKYDGPFEVMSKVGSLAYRLKLPDRLKIHPTFHVSFLKKFHQDLLDAARQQTQRAPPVIRKEFEKTVLKIRS